MNDSYGWWEAKFQIKWLEGREPLMYVDLLLAHKILSPIIDNNKSNIILWRFHRRANRDKYGHQFTFHFYSPLPTAKTIFESIKADLILEDLTRSGEIKVFCTPTDIISKLNIQDTSDPNWPEVIKISWPYFIMGISQMWLKLIDENANIAEKKETSCISDTLLFYQRMENEINNLWKNYGSHAFLHHLNAIFGYQPVFTSIGLERF